MKLLLDTHVLLWAAGHPDRLSISARALIENPDHQLLFSVASIWEVAIKSAQGRNDFHVNARLLRRALLENGYAELPIHGEHVAGLDALPAIHRDPFDRILVAQANIESVTLLTADPVVAAYPGPIRAV